MPIGVYNHKLLRYSDKACIVCDVVFTPNSSQTKYCSDACHKIARHEHRMQPEQRLLQAECQLTTESTTAWQNIQHAKIPIPTAIPQANYAQLSLDGGHFG